MAFEEDLSVFYGVDDGFAVNASRVPAAGGAAQPGVLIFDEPGTLLEDAGVVTAEPSLIMPSTQWGGGGVGDVITLEAADLPSTLQQLAGDYKVRQVLPESDGANRRLVLVRA